MNVTSLRIGDDHANTRITFVIDGGRRLVADWDSRANTLYVRRPDGEPIEIMAGSNELRIRGQQEPT